MAGYLICSRYDTVWHVMNVAVDIEHQRKGVASALLAELYAQVGDEDARFTLEVRRSNFSRSGCTKERASGPPGYAGATTRTTARTRS